ncbi:MAG TPA: hypothetical protein PKM21_01975 [Anaerolineales bacterium]|nr:hypothetical protein [Anaerolineales bacterium]
MKRYIGGEFELSSLPRSVDAIELTQGIAGSWTVSGRAALCALLAHLKKQGVTKILMPAYLCESIIQPVKAFGLAYDFYPVDEDLAAHPDPQKNSAVILIHYFGWLNPSTEALRQSAEDSFVLVEDLTQAVFSSWKFIKGTQPLVFFSLRKFGPVPLGGWYSRSDRLPSVDLMFKVLFWKSLAARLYKYNYLKISPDIDQQAEQTYLDVFNHVESSFDLSCTPYLLDAEAKSLIDGINWAYAAAARRKNWNALSDLLPGNILLPFHKMLPTDVVPLGYVVNCTERDKIRQNLQAAQIFCPIHWRLPEEVSAKRFPISYRLSNTLMTIPIDQRYNPRDMEHISKVIRQAAP